MARICPLCGEGIDENSIIPHICKEIPLPTSGQCRRCGTSLVATNTSPLYDDLCLECHRTMPGNRSEASNIIATRGRILLVAMQGRLRYAWAYVVSSNKIELDVLLRAYGGRVQHHRTNVYKWTCSRRGLLVKVLEDMITHNFELALDMMEYCIASSSEDRTKVLETVHHMYQSLCIHVQGGRRVFPPPSKDPTQSREVARDG